MRTQKNISVIVIDNDIMTRVALENILEESGFTVECFRTGNEGIKRMLNNHSDISLIDVRLPDMSGIEVLKLIKEHQPAVCCILLTAYPNVEDAVKALKLGAFDYLEKPVDLRTIVETINRAIKENNIRDNRIVKKAGQHHELINKKEQAWR